MFWCVFTLWFYQQFSSTCGMATHSIERAKCARSEKEEEENLLFCCVAYCSLFSSSLCCCQNEMNWFGKQFTPSLKRDCYASPPINWQPLPTGHLLCSIISLSTILRIIMCTHRANEFTAIVPMYLKNEHQLSRESSQLSSLFFYCRLLHWETYPKGERTWKRNFGN